MIREGKKLPNDVLKKIPKLVQVLSKDQDIAAIYAFGGLANDLLNPLSDLDFGLLLKKNLTKQERFDKQLNILETMNSMLETDEVDLVLMNDAPNRFAYRILKTGKLLYIGDKENVIEFFERVSKKYLDFKKIRDDFDNEFLRGIGYHG